jgi:hypothetical protein
MLTLAINMRVSECGIFTAVRARPAPTSDRIACDGAITIASISHCARFWTAHHRLDRETQVLNHMHVNACVLIFAPMPVLTGVKWTSAVARKDALFVAIA